MLVDKQHNELSIPVDAEPTDVQVDPDLWVPLMQITFQKRERGVRASLLLRSRARAARVDIGYFIHRMAPRLR